MKRLLTWALFALLAFLPACAYDQIAAERDLRNGQTFCEAHPDVSYCARQRRMPAWYAAHPYFQIIPPDTMEVD